MDEFAEQLARVRARFAAALDGKIGDSFAALEKISGGGEATETVITTHRRLYEMCGLAPTLGFAQPSLTLRQAVHRAVEPTRQSHKFGWGTWIRT